MSDEDLIGYLFDLLDPNERAAVAARAGADPEIAARLEHLRAAFAPMLAGMDAERDEPSGPLPGLAVRTIARVAKHIAEHEPREPQPVATETVIAALLSEVGAESPREVEFGTGTRAKVPQSPTRTPTPAPTPLAPPTDGPEHRTGIRLRADLLVAACIAFVGIGLVLSGVAKARHQSQIIACQNSLRILYDGLSGYAEADPQGRYPQVGTAEYPTADTFATSLVDHGYLPTDYKPGCPAGADCRAYTYTLGFRGPNDQILGLRRPDANSDPADEYDTMPIAADLPSAPAAPTAGPVSPHATCMNVLYVGGNVRFTNSPNVGPRGDDIYRNVFGQVAAGANSNDAVLGGTGDRP
jgi:hypothetical protein